MRPLKLALNLWISFLVMVILPAGLLAETVDPAQEIQSYIERKLFEEELWKEFFIPLPFLNQVELAGERLEEHFLQPLFKDTNQSLLRAAELLQNSTQKITKPQDPRLVLIFGPRIREAILSNLPKEILATNEDRLKHRHSGGREKAYRNLSEDYQVFLWQEGKKNNYIPLRHISMDEAVPKLSQALAVAATRSLDAHVTQARRTLDASETAEEIKTTPSKRVSVSRPIPESRLHSAVADLLLDIANGKPSRLLAPFLLYEETDSLRTIRSGEVFQRLVDKIYENKALRREIEQLYGFEADSSRNPELLRAVFEAFVDVLNADVPQAFVRNVADRLIHQERFSRNRRPERRYIDLVWFDLGLPEEVPVPEDRDKVIKESSHRILERLFLDLERYIDPEGNKVLANRSVFISTEGLLDKEGNLLTRQRTKKKKSPKGEKKKTREEEIADLMEKAALSIRNSANRGNLISDYRKYFEILPHEIRRHLSSLYFLNLVQNGAAVLPEPVNGQRAALGFPAASAKIFQITAEALGLSEFKGESFSFYDLDHSERFLSSFSPKGSTFRYVPTRVDMSKNSLPLPEGKINTFIHIASLAEFSDQPNAMGLTGTKWALYQAHKLLDLGAFLVLTDQNLPKGLKTFVQALGFAVDLEVRELNLTEQMVETLAPEDSSGQSFLRALGQQTEILILRKTEKTKPIGALIDERGLRDLNLTHDRSPAIQPPEGFKEPNWDGLKDQALIISRSFQTPNLFSVVSESQEDELQRSLSMEALRNIRPLLLGDRSYAEILNNALESLSRKGFLPDQESTSLEEEVHVAEVLERKLMTLVHWFGRNPTQANFNLNILPRRKPAEIQAELHSVRRRLQLEAETSLNHEEVKEFLENIWKRNEERLKRMDVDRGSPGFLDHVWDTLRSGSETLEIEDADYPRIQKPNFQEEYDRFWDERFARRDWVYLIPAGTNPSEKFRKQLIAKFFRPVFDAFRAHWVELGFSNRNDALFEAAVYHGLLDRLYQIPTEDLKKVIRERDARLMRRDLKKMGSAEKFKEIYIETWLRERFVDMKSLVPRSRRRIQDAVEREDFEPARPEDLWKETEEHIRRIMDWDRAGLTHLLKRELKGDRRQAAWKKDYDRIFLRPIMARYDGLLLKQGITTKTNVVFRDQVARIILKVVTAIDPEKFLEVAALDFPPLVEKWKRLGPKDLQLSARNVVLKNLEGRGEILPATDWRSGWFLEERPHEKPGSSEKTLTKRLEESFNWKFGLGLWKEMIVSSEEASKLRARIEEDQMVDTDMLIDIFGRDLFEGERAALADMGIDTPKDPRFLNGLLRIFIERFLELPRKEILDIQIEKGLTTRMEREKREKVSEEDYRFHWREDLYRDLEVRHLTAYRKGTWFQSAPSVERTRKHSAGEGHVRDFGQLEKDLEKALQESMRQGVWKTLLSFLEKGTEVSRGRLVLTLGKALFDPFSEAWRAAGIEEADTPEFMNTALNLALNLLPAFQGDEMIRLSRKKGYITSSEQRDLLKAGESEREAFFKKLLEFIEDRLLSEGWLQERSTGDFFKANEEKIAKAEEAQDLSNSSQKNLMEHLTSLNLENEVERKRAEELLSIELEKEFLKRFSAGEWKKMVLTPQENHGFRFTKTTRIREDVLHKRVGRPLYEAFQEPLRYLGVQNADDPRFHQGLVRIFITWMQDIPFEVMLPEVQAKRQGMGKRLDLKKMRAKHESFLKGLLPHLSARKMKVYENGTWLGGVVSTTRGKNPGGTNIALGFGALGDTEDMKRLVGRFQKAAAELGQKARQALSPGWQRIFNEFLEAETEFEQEKRANKIFARLRDVQERLQNEVHSEEADHVVDALAKLYQNPKYSYENPNRHVLLEIVFEALFAEKPTEESPELSGFRVDFVEWVIEDIFELDQESERVHAAALEGLRLAFGAGYLSKAELDRIQPLVDPEQSELEALQVDFDEKRLPRRSLSLGIGGQRHQYREAPRDYKEAKDPRFRRSKDLRRERLKEARPKK